MVPITTYSDFSRLVMTTHGFLTIISVLGRYMGRKGTSVRSASSNFRLSLRIGRPEDNIRRKVHHALGVWTATAGEGTLHFH